MAANVRSIVITAGVVGLFSRTVAFGRDGHMQMLPTAKVTSFNCIAD